MAAIRSFRELKVYQAARVEARRIFVTTRAFPADERFSLTDQIRRSSRAVNGMLAEAWARRRYQAAFVSKINEALGETMETQAWLDHALECGYIEPGMHREFDSAWQSIGAMLQRMMDRADTLCPKSKSHS
ncbi:MAG: four helix bundle protein [Verrucomicrobia bacterium]|jgi:four helix bundle protein|nr:four helix bundle protein [Verrucomicrobiota bacterium]